MYIFNPVSMMFQRSILAWIILIDTCTHTGSITAFSSATTDSELTTVQSTSTKETISCCLNLTLTRNAGCDADIPATDSTLPDEDDAYQIWFKDNTAPENMLLYYDYLSGQIIRINAKDHHQFNPDSGILTITNLTETDAGIYIYQQNMYEYWVLLNIAEVTSEMLKEKLQIFFNNQQVENLTVSQRDPVILNASFSSIKDVIPSAVWVNDDSIIPCMETNSESCAIQANTENVTTLAYTIRATFCGKSMDVERFLLIVEGLPSTGQPTSTEETASCCLNLTLTRNRGCDVEVPATDSTLPVGDAYQIWFKDNTVPENMLLYYDYVSGQIVRINAKDRHQFNPKSGILTITNLTETDAGIHIYQQNMYEYWVLLNIPEVTSEMLKERLQIFYNNQQVENLTVSQRHPVILNASFSSINGVTPSALWMNDDSIIPCIRTNRESCAIQANTENVTTLTYSIRATFCGKSLDVESFQLIVEELTTTVTPASTEETASCCLNLTLTRNLGCDAEIPATDNTLPDEDAHQIWFKDNTAPENLLLYYDYLSQQIIRINANDRHQFNPDSGILTITNSTETDAGIYIYQRNMYEYWVLLNMAEVTSEMLKEKLQIFYNNQQIENLTVSQRDPVILNASFSSINDVTPAALWLNDDSVIPCIQTNTESCAIQPNTVNVTILTYTVRATFCGKSLDIESFMLIVEESTVAFTTMETELTTVLPASTEETASCCLNLTWAKFAGCDVDIPASDSTLPDEDAHQIWFKDHTTPENLLLFYDYLSGQIIRINAKDRHQFNPDSGILTITNLTETDAGIYIYQQNTYEYKVLLNIAEVTSEMLKEKLKIFYNNQQVENLTVTQRDPVILNASFSSINGVTPSALWVHNDFVIPCIQTNSEFCAIQPNTVNATTLIYTIRATFCGKSLDVERFLLIVEESTLAATTMETESTTVTATRESVAISESTTSVHTTSTEKTPSCCFNLTWTRNIGCDADMPATDSTLPDEDNAHQIWFKDNTAPENMLLYYDYVSGQIVRIYAKDHHHFNPESGILTITNLTETDAGIYIYQQNMYEYSVLLHIAEVTSEMLKEKLQILYNNQQVQNLTVSQRDPVILNASFSSINDVTPSVLWVDNNSIIPCLQTGSESCAIQPNTVNVTTLTYTIRAIFCGKSLDVESFLLIVEESTITTPITENESTTTVYSTSTEETFYCCINLTMTRNAGCDAEIPATDSTLPDEDAHQIWFKDNTGPENLLLYYDYMSQQIITINANDHHQFNSDSGILTITNLTETDAGIYIYQQNMYKYWVLLNIAVSDVTSEMLKEKLQIFYNNRQVENLRVSQRDPVILNASFSSINGVTPAALWLSDDSIIPCMKTNSESCAIQPNTVNVTTLTYTIRATFCGKYLDVQSFLLIVEEPTTTVSSETTMVTASCCFNLTMTRNAGCDADIPARDNTLPSEDAYQIWFKDYTGPGNMLLYYDYLSGQIFRVNANNRHQFNPDNGTLTITNLTETDAGIYIYQQNMYEYQVLLDIAEVTSEMLKDNLKISYNDKQVENLTVSQRDPVILNASFSPINNVTPSVLWVNDDYVLPCMQENSRYCAVQPNTVNITTFAYTVRATFCGITIDVESFLLKVKESTTTTHTPTPSETEFSTALLFGIVFGGILGVTLIIILLVFILNYLQTREPTLKLCQFPDGPAYEGTNLKFICETTNVNPKTKLVWKVSGQAIQPTTGTVGKWNTQLGKRGELTLRVDRTLNGQKVECCIQGNPKGMDSITLYVICLQMTQHPCGTLADNTDVAITCMTSNIPPADNLVWAILQEGRHPIHNMNDSKIKRHKTGNMLIVTANKILHHKVVECCLSENPEMRDAVTMHVKKITLTQFPPGPVLANTEVTFTCTTTKVAPNDSLVWKIGDRAQNPTEGVLTSNRHQRKSVLILNVGKEHHNTKVECSVNGDSRIKAAVTLDVRVGGIILTQSPPGTLLENTEVTFTCEVDEAPPNADVIWTIGQKVRNSTMEHKTEWINNLQRLKSVLTIFANKSLNNTTVECHLSENPEISDSLTLKVRSSGILLSQHPPGPVLENTEVAFTCLTYKIKPPINLVWKLGEKESSDGDTINERWPSSEEKEGVLILRLNKAMNNQVVQCYVREKPKVKDALTLKFKRKPMEFICPVYDTKVVVPEEIINHPENRRPMQFIHPVYDTTVVVPQENLDPLQKRRPMDFIRPVYDTTVVVSEESLHHPDEKKKKNRQDLSNGIATNYTYTVPEVRLPAAQTNGPLQCVTPLDINEETHCL